MTIADNSVESSKRSTERFTDPGGHKPNQHLTDFGKMGPDEFCANELRSDGIPQGSQPQRFELGMVPISVTTSCISAAVWVCAHFILFGSITLQYHPAIAPAVLIATGLAAILICGVLGGSKSGWYLMFWSAAVGAAYWTVFAWYSLHNDRIRESWSIAGTMPGMGMLLQVFILVVYSNFVIHPYVIMFCLVRRTAREHCRFAVRGVLANLKALFRGTGFIW